MLNCTPLISWGQTQDLANTVDEKGFLIPFQTRRGVSGEECFKAGTHPVFFKEACKCRDVCNRVRLIMEPTPKSDRYTQNLRDREARKMFPIDIPRPEKSTQAGTVNPKKGDQILIIQISIRVTGPFPTRTDGHSLKHNTDILPGRKVPPRGGDARRVNRPFGGSITQRTLLGYFHGIVGDKWRPDGFVNRNRHD